MSYFKPRNLLLVLAVVLALVLLVFVAVQHKPESQLQTLAKSMPEGVDVALQDIDYTHIEGGQARWRLVAQKVEHRMGSDLLSIEKPQLSFFDEQGEIAGAMQSGQGTVSENYQKVQLFEDVVLQNASGYTLYTDRLDYDNASQVAQTDAHVRIEAKGMKLEGAGMVFNVQKKTMQLHADVKGYLEPR